MRSIIPAAVVLLIALTATPAGSQSFPDAAGTTCAQFLKARTGDALYRQASNWLSGYASGFAAALRAGRQAAVPTNDQLFRSAADYCQANPAATIAEAANAWAPPLPPVPEAPPPGRGFLDLNVRPTIPGGRR